MQVLAAVENPLGGGGATPGSASQYDCIAAYCSSVRMEGVFALIDPEAVEIMRRTISSGFADRQRQNFIDNQEFRQSARLFVPSAAVGIDLDVIPMVIATGGCSSSRSNSSPRAAPRWCADLRRHLTSNCARPASYSIVAHRLIQVLPMARQVCVVPSRQPARRCPRECPCFAIDPVPLYVRVGAASPEVPAASGQRLGHRSAGAPG